MSVSYSVGEVATNGQSWESLLVVILFDRNTIFLCPFSRNKNYSVLPRGSFRSWYLIQIIIVCILCLTINQLRSREFRVSHRRLITRCPPFNTVHFPFPRLLSWAPIPDRAFLPFLLSPIIIIIIRVRESESESANCEATLHYYHSS